MIIVTENAEKQFEKMLVDGEHQFVRLVVNSGGCSGFSWKMDWGENQNNDDEKYGNLLVDEISMGLLEGATVDYKQDLVGSYFKLDIPASLSNCGCGTSFSI